MSDIKLFQYGNSTVTELQTQSAPVEKWLQNLMETNMEPFLGVRFLASEYSTSKSHRGRIDSLGIDENNCPVIIEYKRHMNENVINQGLFYLDWLMEHQADFKLLVMEKYGAEAAAKVDWTGTRLLCIAGDFNKYDEYAVQQINRNIELLRYSLFEGDFLMLELVNSTTATTTLSNGKAASTGGTAKAHCKDSEGFVYSLGRADESLTELYETLRDYAVSLGDDVQEKILKHYAAFKRIKNFTCVIINFWTGDPHLKVYLKLDPQTVELEEGFTHDASSVGHYGTGNLEVRIRTNADLEKAKPLIEKSYQNS